MDARELIIIGLSVDKLDLKTAVTVLIRNPERWT
jgi:hypothetical protein